MLQCEICAETLVETALGKEEAGPNQKENNERVATKLLVMPAVSTLYHDRPSCCC